MNRAKFVVLKGIDDLLLQVWDKAANPPKYQTGWTDARVADQVGKHLACKVSHSSVGYVRRLMGMKLRRITVRLFTDAEQQTIQRGLEAHGRIVLCRGKVGKLWVEALESFVRRQRSMSKMVKRTKAWKLGVPASIKARREAVKVSANGA